MANIVLVNTLSFPNGDAGSVRVYFFAKALQLLGHTTYVITKGKNNFGENTYYGVNYYAGLSGLRIIDKILIYRKIISKLDTMIDVDCVICYTSDIILLYIVKKWCRKKNIELICDVVEWYSKQQFKFGIFSWPLQAKNIVNRFLISSSVRVIAISYYLEKYYKEKGCKTVRIPIFFDVNSYKCIYKEHERLYLIYAGSPGKKDLLYTILQGIGLLSNSEIRNLKFIVVGVNAETIQDCLDESTYEKIKGCLEICGRIPREQVLEKYCDADFSVLLRNGKLRVSKAGFPSKVIESMSCGIPMICNITSDLGDFIKNGENGLVVDECTSESFAKTISNALKLSKGELEIMKQNARQCVEQNFNISSFNNQFEEIISL